ncbi:hypothetical protein [Notoacmeibacter marinus]|nr:hypothetical protein [Notoacmeibacter marinus]
MGDRTMRASQAVWIAAALLSGVPNSALAQFTIDSPVILSPKPSLTGPRYAAPDRLDRDRRFDPNATPEKGVSNYADRDFLEENISPFLRWGAERQKLNDPRGQRLPRPSVPTFDTR